MDRFLCYQNKLLESDLSLIMYHCKFSDLLYDEQEITE